MKKCLSLFPLACALITTLVPLTRSRAANVYPRIFAGGVSGANALANPANSDQFRANGGGAYLHANGWASLTEAEKVATQANFAQSDITLEIGFDTAASWLNYYKTQLLNRGMRATFITSNVYANGNVPTVAQWNDFLTTFRNGGVDSRTLIVPTFEYANYNSTTLSTNKVSQRTDFQQIITASGGLSIDAPPAFFLAREQAYRDWVYDAVQWARSHGCTVMLIISPHNSGTNYATDTQTYLAALNTNNAMPNMFGVENYSTADPATYTNIVGSEDVAYQELGLAYRLQTQYLTGLMGRSTDIDGDGLTAAEESALGRSDFSPDDLAFDFGTAGNVQGWTAANVSGLTAAGGTLQGTTTSTDPQLVRSGLWFDGGRTKNLLVRMKASAAGSVQVYWGTNGGGIVGANLMTASYGVANTWQTLVVPLSTNANWNNQTISALRIDPISVSGATFQIDYVIGSGGDYDHDTFLDTVEGFGDTNGDGIVDAFDIDSDGDGVPDWREGVLGHNRLDPSDMFFGGATTALAGNSEGWTAGNTSSVVAGSSGLIKGTASTGDPQITHQNFHFLGSKAKKIQVYLKSSSATTAQLFWGIATDNTFTASRVANANYTTPGAWQLVTFDLTANTAWTTQTVVALRIDPTNVSGATYEVQYISALP